MLATLVTVAGSSYRRPGARLLLTASGSRIGSISGGCLEEDVLTRARIVMETGAPDLVTYDTTSENDLIWGVGLGCHGVVRVLLEKISVTPEWARALAANLNTNRPTHLSVVWSSNTATEVGTALQDTATDHAPAGAEAFLNVISPPVRFAIFGAGDDAQPLFRIAKELGWHVTVADPRAAMVSRDRFPDADALVSGAAAELVRRAQVLSETIAIVMTHHYVNDLPVLRDLFTVSDSYIGLLGPKKRAERILTDLTKAGALLTREKLAQLHAPVGFDLGAETPEEVALSIIAEVQAFLKKRDGRPLRERTRPIHG